MPCFFQLAPSLLEFAVCFAHPWVKLCRVCRQEKILERGFVPQLTEIGRRHPVTADLIPSANGKPTWGRWFRHIEANVRQGNVLMKGVNDLPLLILHREGKGRIAQLLSDHIWLWGRGLEGGGPQAEILRRLAHWLMKEPQLEEERLVARFEKGQVVIERYSLSPESPEVTVTTPSGARQNRAA